MSVRRSLVIDNQMRTPIDAVFEMACLRWLLAPRCSVLEMTVDTKAQKGHTMISRLLDY